MMSYEVQAFIGGLIIGVIVSFALVVAILVNSEMPEK